MRRAALLLLAALGAGALLWMGTGSGGRAAERDALADDAAQVPEVAAADLGSPEKPREPEPRADGAAASALVDTAPSAPQPDPTPPLDELVGCVLYGRVRSTDGGPFAGWKPKVSLTDAAGIRRHTEVTPEGHYSLAGLAAGRWSLSTGGVGFLTAGAELELTAAEPVVRRDFVLERATVLAIHVRTPDGRNLAEVLQERRVAKLPTPAVPFPVATREPPGPTIPEAADPGNETVGVGAFWGYGPLVEAAPPGTLGVLVLTVHPPVFVSLCIGERVYATQSVSAGQDEVAFVIDAEGLLERQATVTVRFVAEDTGAPLTGSLNVDGSTIWNVQGGTWSQPMLPGKHVLSFWCNGYARIPLEIVLEPGQALDLGQQLLPPERTIAGRLLDADGQPVSGRLEVGLRDATGKLRARDDWHHETDEDGAFLIGGLLAGRYVVRTLGDDQVRFPGRDEPPTEWVTGNVEVSTLGGSVTGLELRCARAGILVLKGAETLPPESRCKVLDERGDVLRYSAFYPGFVPRFALPPGPCTFVLCDGEWSELRRWPLTIGAGVLELDLAP